jgi:protein-glutamine gamma-glutamyltransferase
MARHRDDNPVLFPVRASIERYSDWCIYGMVAAAFITLAGTGGLDWLTLGAMTCALVLRGYLLWKRRTVMISESLTTLLTIGYFGFFAADYFVISRGFLPATVHLAVFAVIIRMFSLRRDRDYVTLAILAFLMVLAAAILTVDSLFLLSFAAFLLLAVANFVLFEIRHSFTKAELQAHGVDLPSSQSSFPVSIARVAFGLMLMILAGSALLFLILPRRSAGYLGAYSFGEDLSSGFSDHVRLGQIGRIQQSDAVVMHIEIEGDRTGRYDLYWRGVALSDFDGHVWSKPRREFVLPRSGENNGFVIPNPEIANNAWVRGGPVAEMVHYRVLMEPIGTNVFFLAPQPRAISGNYQLLATDSGGAVYDFDSQHGISRYEADSDISKPSPEKLRDAAHDYPPEIAQMYLRLPPMDPRVRQLAHQVTTSKFTDFDKVAALENYLRTNYQYTLDLPKTEPRDPIAQFLFERKRGHCEYFASAMAVMLRSLEIPSRVVNGFRSDEFNDLTGNYILRAKDAHAWVEVFFPGYGWQTFDPTPAGGVGTPQGWSRVALYFDAMASFWREWVVSYDVSHQYVVGQSLVNETRNVWERGRAWARARYESILEWGHHVHTRAERSPLEWIFTALALALAFLMLRNWRSIARFVREQRLRAHPERDPEEAASIWYRRMARTVGRGGTQKPEAFTAREFVEMIANPNLKEPVARFTEVYESARFGNSAEDAERLPELYQEVETAARLR